MTADARQTPTGRSWPKPFLNMTGKNVVDALNDAWIADGRPPGKPHVHMQAMEWVLLTMHLGLATTLEPSVNRDGIDYMGVNLSSSFDLQMGTFTVEFL